MSKRKSLLDAFRPSAAQSAAKGVPPGPATAPTPETARPRRTLAVELAAIRTGERLRAALDRAKVEAIAASMAVIGLQTPILLRPWRAPDAANPDRWGADDAGLFAVVAGAHRLAAAAELGWIRIEAIVVDGTPDEMRLIEIDENLARAELTALGRARFLAARKAIYARSDPRANTADNPQDIDFVEGNSSAKIAQPSFAAAAAEDIGLSRRMVYRAVEIGEGLCEEAGRALADTPLANREGDLHRLARMPAAKQRVIAGLCRTPSGPATLKTALAMLEGRSGVKRARRRSKTPAGLAALHHAWRAAGDDARRRFRQWLDADAENTYPGSTTGKKEIH